MQRFDMSPADYFAEMFSFKEKKIKGPIFGTYTSKSFSNFTQRADRSMNPSSKTSFLVLNASIVLFTRFSTISSDGFSF